MIFTILFGPHKQYPEDLQKYIILDFILILSIIFVIFWAVYYNITWFRKVITVADKYSRTRQVGSLEVSSNHQRMSTDIRNTRQTVEDYYLVDTERNIYSVEDCLLCGFYYGNYGKYARAMPGDRIEIMGYGGYFDGIPVVYSVRRLN